jgi:transposase, IS30 family
MRNFASSIVKHPLQTMAHLTQVQRYEIAAYKKAGKNQTFIAAALCVHKSTISRELRRNADGRNGSYKAELAHRKSERRKQEKPKHERFTESMQDVARPMLMDSQYSPEQLVGQCKRLGIAMVSHERLYQWIWSDKRAGGALHTQLRRKGRKYRKRGSAKDSRGIITGRVGIEHRPPVVDKKTRFGDFEIDTVIGKNHKGALLTINDRASGKVFIRKLASKEAAALADKAIDALTPFKNLAHTITADNGKEFAHHATIAQNLDISFYFARPYHSWERGANENTNGLIRQYFPKGSDFEGITEQEIQVVEDKLNNRPRKKLGFLSPNEKFKQLNSENQVAFMT